MCTGEFSIDFHDLEDLQLLDSGESLKSTDNEKVNKLALSIEKYGILSALQVWKHKDKTYCFDAHHRVKALKKIESKGIKIPLLPATRCLAETKSEAKKLLLLKESTYSWVNILNLESYMQEIDFNFDEASEVLEIPDFDFNKKVTDFKNIDKEYTDENCELPIVPEFFENHQCFIIVTHNEIDENFVRSVLNLDSNRESLSGDNKVRKSNVIDVEELRQVWAKK